MTIVIGIAITALALATQGIQYLADPPAGSCTLRKIISARRPLGWLTALAIIGLTAWSLVLSDSKQAEMDRQMTALAAATGRIEVVSERLVSTADDTLKETRENTQGIVGTFDATRLMMHQSVRIHAAALAVDSDSQLAYIVRYLEPVPLMGLDFVMPNGSDQSREELRSFVDQLRRHVAKANEEWNSEKFVPAFRIAEIPPAEFRLRVSDEELAELQEAAASDPAALDRLKRIAKAEYDFLQMLHQYNAIVVRLAALKKYGDSGRQALDELHQIDAAIRNVADKRDSLVE